MLGEPEFYFLRNSLDKILKDNNFSFNSINKENEDLDSLPIPCWDLVINRLSFSGGLKKKKCIPILGERGCPYSCFKIFFGITCNKRSNNNNLTLFIYFFNLFYLRLMTDN